MTFKIGGVITHGLDEGIQMNHGIRMEQDPLEMEGPPWRSIDGPFPGGIAVSPLAADNGDEEEVAEDDEEDLDDDDLDDEDFDDDLDDEDFDDDDFDDLDDEDLDDLDDEEEEEEEEEV